MVTLAWAIGLFFSWQRDNAVLRERVMMITVHHDAISARIRAVNDWVYHNKGFDKNNQYFVLSALGPTPIQVMAQGGDCADKSRLVAAMLNSVGIDAGLVMISQCPHCKFIHTVVEAQYEGGRMIVDPTWDIDYPTEDGRFLGVSGLSGTSRGVERLAELRQQRPATDKIRRMPAAEATFDNAAAINWDRNAATHLVAATLRLMGYEAETLLRPRILEDPKLFVIWSLIGVATALVLAGYLFDRGARVGTNTRSVFGRHTI
jgi:hypothetical protein